MKYLITSFLIALVVGLLVFRPPKNTNKIKQNIPVAKTSVTNINPTSKSYKVPILLYHYVENITDKKDTIRQSLNTTPYIFEDEIKTLVNNNYTFMTASELSDVIDGKKELPAKPVLLTFDDGHWDLDTVVLPILKKYHVKATAYIITGFIGSSDFLNKYQLNDIINSGLIEIGAHTVHHIALRSKLYPTVYYEVNQSKAYLENNYHIKVRSFAYPYGSYDNQAMQIVKDAGFSNSVSMTGTP